MFGRRQRKHKNDIVNKLRRIRGSESWGPDQWAFMTKLSEHITLMTNRYCIFVVHDGPAFMEFIKNAPALDNFSISLVEHEGEVAFIINASWFEKRILSSLVDGGHYERAIETSN